MDTTVLVPPRPRVDAETLASLAWLMDAQFRIPGVGWRFGLNALIDLLPGAGDMATSVVAATVLFSAVRMGVPRVALMRMVFNILVYAIGGLLPFAGDAFDTWWKPNLRNMKLLRRYMGSPDDRRQARLADWLFAGAAIALTLLLVVASWAILAWFLNTARHMLA